MARFKVLYPTLAAGIAAAAIVAVPVSTHAAASPQVRTVSASQTGVLSPVRAGSRAENAAATTAVAQRGVRSLPGRHASARQTATPAVALTASAGSASILSNFDGTSSRDSQVTNYNQEFEPPDQGLCVGNGNVVEPVNSAYRVFNTSGKTLAGPFNVNDLYDEGSLQFTSDPRCYYDPATNAWFATILFLATSNGNFGTTSHLDIAVNPTGNPGNVWTQYQIDTTDSTNHGCGAKRGGCFGDQPKLGIDQNNLYVSTDEFGITSNTYNGAQLFVFAKRDLIAGTPVHYALFRNLKNADGSVAGPLQPAISTGDANAEYLMDSLDPTGQGDDRIGVWALTKGAVVAGGGSPTLSTVIVGSEPYSSPPNAVQKGTSRRLSSGDDRMQQTQYINGTIWGELATAVDVRGDSASRAAASWFAVSPTLQGSRISGATIVHQGTVAEAGLRGGNDVIYPALQADSNGNAVMVFTLSGESLYPSAAYSVLKSGQSRFGSITIAAAGTGHYDPQATRWGDYSWATVDLSSDTFWLATEYVPPVSSQTTNRKTNWGTRVFEVTPG